MERTPLLLVGDGPAEPTGLGRILRDLGAHLASADLPIELVSVGGSVPPLWRAWEHYGLDRQEEWGAGQVAQIYRERFGRRPGILWVIWDPGRLLPYAQLNLPVQKWAYTAIDGQNQHDQISGPARAALESFDRVLGYGRWGAEVLKRSLSRPIEYLPHGIEGAVWRQPDAEYAEAVLGPQRKRSDVVIGCVMTNQERKDHATCFGLLRKLRDRGIPVFGWLHTDVAVKAWSIPQLVADFQLETSVQVTAYPMDDAQLAAMYHACDVVVLPSLGEGFGYPLVEALAAGTPVIHGDCGGGAELLPRTEWRVPVRTTRLDGIYALRRPVWDVEDWANATERCLRWQDEVGPRVVPAYCRGAVAHLEWDALWPRWASWVRKGL